VSGKVDKVIRVVKVIKVVKDFLQGFGDKNKGKRGSIVC
jgi:hypothetical protein